MGKDRNNIDELLDDSSLIDYYNLSVSEKKLSNKFISVKDGYKAIIRCLQPIELEPYPVIKSGDIGIEGIKPFLVKSGKANGHNQISIYMNLIKSLLTATSDNTKPKEY